MLIRKHALEGEGIDFMESPNHGGLFGADLPDTLVIHYTAGGSKASSVDTLCNPDVKASAHVVVGRDGSITQLVPFNTIAWHAGKSSHQDRTGLNKYSIGIEVDNAGRLTRSGSGYTSWFGKVYPEDEVVEATHRNESTPSHWHAYTEKQIKAVSNVCAALIGKYKISTLLGHEEISPGRKSDPGPAFPLDKMRERLLVRDRADEDAAETVQRQHPGLVTAFKLNIRSSPGRGGTKVAPPLSKGTKVEILQESHGWYEVDVHSRGWVKKDYIRT